LDEISFAVYEEMSLKVKDYGRPDERAVTGDSEARLIKYWTLEGRQNNERQINYV
jgi:hypothetical protein